MPSPDPLKTWVWRIIAVITVIWACLLIWGGVELAGYLWNMGD